MKYNLPERVFQEIVQYAKNYNVSKIILFGSRARGTHTERSDVDIAVIGGDFDGFYWEIQENIFSLLLFDIVEYADTISEELKAEIERDGIVIYEKDG